MSLLDLVLVVVILGILGMVGLPAMQTSVRDVRLSAAADEVAAAIEYAQLSALAWSVSTRVSFDVGADTVAVEKAAAAAAVVISSGSELSGAQVETTVFVAMDNPLDRGSPYVLSPARTAWLAQVDIASVSFGGNSWVVFDSWGRPSAGGSLTLASRAKQVVLVLDARSGKVVIQ